ncbi:cytochrome P450 2F3-like [Xiphias gladius]|uniref:cytochrome P450 2F3-like n=1 Tax=Xiphias gladius TaxID=8245 RepID=UPI001A995398|nr:cytochrome P450 2F3-like [Xiphias gladius]
MVSGAYWYQLRKTHGNVYSLFLGPRPIVVISGTKAMKEALVSKAIDFAGRPQDLYVNEITQRKDKTLSPQIMFHNLASNIIIQVLFGKRYEYDDEFIKVVVQCFTENSRIANGPWAMLYDSFPMIRNLVLPFTKTFKNVKICQNLTILLVIEHKKTRVPGEPRDFVDCYLDELDKRCQQEIDRVLDGKRQASFDDRHNMPYMQAVIHEVQRIANTVPLSVFHSTTKDTELMGYSIPKGTMIIPNMTSVLNEEGQWKFPHEFNPENFLNDQGKFVKPAAFMPFSAGPRLCLGEGLARMDLFLIMVTLLRKFKFIWPKDAGEPDVTPIFGATLSPKPYCMKVQLRAMQ